MLNTMRTIKLSFTIILLKLITSSIQDENKGFAFNFNRFDCCKGVQFQWGYENYFDECCGNFTINSRQEACCVSQDGKVSTVATNGEDTEGCCGGRLYDRKHYRCCDNTNLFPRKEREWCCGAAVFDESKEICCNKKVIPKEGKGCHTECCGNSAFDFTTEICCSNNEIIKKTSEFSGCCGGQPFDKRTDLCCKGNIVSRKEVGIDKLCCGISIYNSFTQICCNETIHEKISIFSDCCGNDTYEKDEQICCGSLLFHRTSLLMQCCGEKTYDYSTHFCCEGEIFPLDDNCHEHCCSQDGTGYKEDYQDDLSIVDDDIEPEEIKEEVHAASKSPSSTYSLPLLEIYLILVALKMFNII